SHHPSAIDLGLERVRTVAERLGVLSPSARVITIAGTNGKGSCVATLEALLSAEGKRFGAYTSPHFLHYNERVRLQAEPVSDQQLCAAFARIDEARGDISLTYFEFGTLAAMDIFNRELLDYWLLEVGLGGRLDAVNIVDPNVAVITSVAIDHEAWLGSDREKIGFEKAGICRQQATLVCADAQPPSAIFNKVQQVNCPVVWWGSDFGIDGELLFTRSGCTVSKANIQLPLPSVVAALQVCELEGCLPPEPALQQVLSSVQLTGRMQVLKYAHATLILDVAHNPAAAQLLAQHLAHRKLQPMPAIVAVMADKDIEGVFAPLLPWVSHWHCVRLADNPRAAEPQVLARALEKMGVASSCICCDDSVSGALAQLNVPPAGLQEEPQNVLVFGSFFTVAQALSYRDVGGQ
ncbi:MAG TPA: folylpolyglutamate synthase/dihydrofolate synthase family protein, partial [Marinagarivorans sp.]